MDKSQMGKIHIPLDLIEKDPEAIAKIFSLLKFVPVRAECMYVMRRIEYIGISDRFERVDIGNIAPKYALNISEDENGRVIAVEAVRLEK